MYIGNNKEYWLASPYPSTRYYTPMCTVCFDGNIYATAPEGGITRGIRPTVCINSRIQIVDENSDGVLEIKY